MPRQTFNTYPTFSSDPDRDSGLMMGENGQSRDESSLVDPVKNEDEFFMETGKDQDKNSNRQTKPKTSDFFSRR